MEGRKNLKNDFTPFVVVPAGPMSCCYCNWFKSFSNAEMDYHGPRCKLCRDAGVCSSCGIDAACPASSRPYTKVNLCWACFNMFFGFIDYKKKKL